MNQRENKNNFNVTGAIRAFVVGASGSVEFEGMVVVLEPDSMVFCFLFPRLGFACGGWREVPCGTLLLGRLSASYSAGIINHVRQTGNKTYFLVSNFSPCVAVRIAFGAA